MIFNSNNGGGNPYHDENGRFASSNTAHGGSDENKKEPKDSMYRNSGKEDAISRKIMDMGFSPDGKAKVEDEGLDTEGYANMVLDENRSIPYYGRDGKDWDTLRQKRIQMLAKEPTDKLNQIKSEINQVARKWADAKRRKKASRDELLSLKSLFVEVNTELAKREGR